MGSLRLLLVGTLVLGCATTTTSEQASPCGALADEVVDAIATFATTIDAEYQTLELATIPTDPPPKVVRRFKAEMQRFDNRRRAMGCSPADYGIALRERAHRITGDGYFARTYRIGLANGPYGLEGATEQGSSVVLPSTWRGQPPGPQICSSRLCGLVQIAF